MDAEKKAPESLRELMPVGYTRKLMKLTGCMQRQTMCDIVLTENPRAKYWPAALQLAEETDPERYAAWAAAHPDKLPAVPVAA
jgi:hypothetical protein